MRILIAEDDPKLLKSLVHIFEMNHYAVDGVDNGVDAFDFASSDEYDGLVLDIMMPGMDGVTLLKKLRANGITTPALFLTARTEIDQRIEGLDAGADDYLPKPFSTGELLARVRAMLRRKDNFTPDMLTFGALSLNRSTYELVCNGKTQSLSGKEFQVMEMLMQNPKTIVTAEQLITHIWDGIRTWIRAWYGCISPTSAKSLKPSLLPWQSNSCVTPDICWRQQYDL